MKTRYFNLLILTISLLCGIQMKAFATNDEESITLNVPEDGITTFSCDVALDFSGVKDVQAFFCSGINDDEELVLVPVEGTVPAGTGLCVRANEGKYNIPVVEEAEEIDQENYLLPALKNMTNVVPEQGMMNYVLKNGKFHKTVLMTLEAGKAYVTLPYDATRRARGVKTDDSGYDIHVADEYTLNFVPVGDYKYATVCLPWKSWVSNKWEGGYLVNWDGTYACMTKLIGQLIPSNTAIIIRKTNNDDQTETATIRESGSWPPTGNDFTANRLVGYDEDTEITGSSSVAYYSLNYETVDDVRVLGFYAPKGSNNDAHGSFTAKAQKAYLRLVTSADAKSINIVWEGDIPTTISDVYNADKNANVGTMLNVAGQIVEKDYKGVVIINGKKYLNK